MKKVEPLIDEGLRISLVETAFFDGDLEIPHIAAPEEIVIPKGMIPFSQRAQDRIHENFVCFYENDVNFREILTKTEDYVEDLKRFPGIVTPDCSLYVDAPLVVQLIDIYLNRAVGYYLKKQGLNGHTRLRFSGIKSHFLALTSTASFPLEPMVKSKTLNLNGCFGTVWQLCWTSWNRRSFWYMGQCQNPFSAGLKTKPDSCNIRIG